MASLVGNSEVGTLATGLTSVATSIKGMNVEKYDIDI